MLAAATNLHYDAGTASHPTPGDNAGWLLRNETASARARVWGQPALKRLQDPGLGFEEYASITLRLLLAYRHAESYLDTAWPGAAGGLGPYTPRSPLLERDLRGLGRNVPQARSWDWAGAKGRAAYLGIRCGLSDIESGADAVARRLWRYHPELWGNAADYWRYLRSLDFKPPHFDADLEGELSGTTEQRIATRSALDICRMFCAYLSA
jgi:hypothetical protein